MKKRNFKFNFISSLQTSHEFVRTPEYSFVLLTPKTSHFHDIFLKRRKNSFTLSSFQLCFVPFLQVHWSEFDEGTDYCDCSQLWFVIKLSSRKNPFLWNLFKFYSPCQTDFIVLASFKFVTCNFRLKITTIIIKIQVWVRVSLNLQNSLTVSFSNCKGTMNFFTAEFMNLSLIRWVGRKHQGEWRMENDKLGEKLRSAMIMKWKFRCQRMNNQTQNWLKWNETEIIREIMRSNCKTTLN